MSDTKTFDQLGLDSRILSALVSLGYETPTPIQAESIPHLLDGQDVLAQAQTGTGKTAAFALPGLSRLDLDKRAPQILVIAPTRELAIQVAEAFQSYAKHLNGFNVAPIYGGQEYGVQLRALKRGAHVVVGTPGRVMDHIRRGTLKMQALKMVVLDEADEMLKMGFIDDIEFILSQIPQNHQTALFSATIPAPIQKIAKRYLKDAKKIKIKPAETTVSAIEQCYMRVSAKHKLESLTRFLEVEEFNAAIIFSRTKTGSAELAEKLRARGYASAALNGDMKQSLRKETIDKLKRGQFDIVVATDVAARGIDVERITHVINYDVPHDTESYIHRIGRTGRAGRQGKAVLFITPREQRLFKDIERAVHTTIAQIDPPSVSDVTKKRSQQMVTDIKKVIQKGRTLKPYYEMVEELINQTDSSSLEVAAGLAYLLQQSNPLSSHDISSAEPESGAPKRSRPTRFKGRKLSTNPGKKKATGKKKSSDGKSSDGKSAAKSRPKKKSSDGKSAAKSRPKKPKSKKESNAKRTPYSG